VEFRASLRDITDRKRLEAELQHQALHDPLTGLGNRILLQRQLEAAVAHDDRFGHVSVMLLDLDGFKHVNDTHGHTAGDEVLRLVAARLRRLTRPTDTIARTGGDEFVLLCPGTDEGTAVRIAQRIIDAIRSPLSVGEVTVQLGVSVGVAHQDGDLADADGLLIEADRAMYVAKRAGRSRVGLADRVVG
jgi:diguanylate cyclase (GGDEF)-like protein